MTAEKSEFWSATEQLNLIYRWARASYVAPWALLAAVLPRVIATTGPHVMLPGPPAPASLNLGVVLVGRSGAGKGVTDKLSRVVWPADIHEEGLGSGQGIAELFKQQKNQEDQIDRALITVSEIDHLAALNAGQGNNTRAALKAALTGDRLGSKGASAATTRAVPADSYRLCLSISAQFGHCGVLLDDVSGGTPQRPLWMLVTDPDMPKEVGPIPDRVLDIALPPWARSGSQVLIQYGPPEIREYINAGLWASGRGDVAAIDGHRTLTRLKVAAALAVLDHRSVIGGADWQLSEVIMAKSDATRDAVMEYDRQAARAKIRDRAIARARGEEFVSDHKLQRAKSAVIRWLGRDTELAANQLRSKLKADLRDHFGAATAELVAEGLIAEIHVERGTRYRLTSEVQGVPRVQGPYPQLKGGVPEVQGVPTPHDAGSPEVHAVPGVHAPKTQVEMREPGVPRVPAGRVTVLDSRSSHETEARTTPESPNGAIKGETMKSARQKVCQRCFVSLPLAATGPLCDECVDSPERPVLAKHATTPAPGIVVHNGTTPYSHMPTTQLSKPIRRAQ